MAFMLSETAVGASLVLFQLVADNLSVTRAVVMAIHLVNTFLLMAALTLTAWWASGGRAIQFKGQGKWGWAMVAGFLAMLFLAASGGVTALGDTLFPAGSLSEGIAAELSSTAHFLVRLRVYHPLIAIMVGAYLVVVMMMLNAQRAGDQAKLLAKAFTGIYIFQLIFGAFNVVLLAPVWMQLGHLFISDVLLIVLVLYIATAFAEPARVDTSVGAIASACG
jgi:heme A synthase